MNALPKRKSGVKEYEVNERREKKEVERKNKKKGGSFYDFKAVSKKKDRQKKRVPQNDMRSFK